MALWSYLVFVTSMVPTALILVLVIAGAYVRYTKSVKYHHPPGPAAVPLLGNVHQLPMEYQQRKLAEWGRQFGMILCTLPPCLRSLTMSTPVGDVVFAKFFRTPVVVLNTKEAAMDLMEKRSAKYSDRPPFVLLRELCVFSPHTIAAASRLTSSKHGLGQRDQQSPIWRTLPEAPEVAPGRVHVQGRADELPSHPAEGNLHPPVGALRTTRAVHGPHYTVRRIFSHAVGPRVLKAVCVGGLARWCWTSRTAIGLRPSATPSWRPRNARPWRPCSQGARVRCWWTSSLSVSPYQCRSTPTTVLTCP